MRIKRRKNRTARMNTRVDFTPMVDMNMLLLTFFMFCTTLSKPQMLDIAMPVADVPTDIQPTVGSEAITIILANKNTIYYYEGVPNYEDYTSLKEIDYSQLRNILLQKNSSIIQKVNALADRKNMKQLSVEEYKEAVREVKKEKKGTVAIIKATDDATYQNLIDVLDEMAICSIAKYAIIDMVDGDDFLIKNYESKGLYAQENSIN